MKVELTDITDDAEMKIAKAGGISHDNQIENLEDARELNKKLISWGHMSPIEFGDATFYVEDMSRVMLAQLSRHRHTNLMVKSQRYNTVGNIDPELPPIPPDLPNSEDDNRNDKYIFTTNQEKFITEQYKKGFSMYQLADKYDCGSSTIKRIVRRNDGNIRDISKGKTPEVPHEYFSEINKPIKAYLLGLIYADGSLVLRKDSGDSLTISQHKKYKAFLKHLSRLFKGEIYKDGHGRGLILRFRSKKMAEDIQKYGVVPNKSDKLDFPSFLEEEYVPHFLRGFFDGDGYISDRDSKLYIGICGQSKKLIEGIYNYLNDNIIGGKSGSISYRDKTRVTQCSWSKPSDTKKIVEYLYQDFDIRYVHPKKIQSAVKYSDIVKDRVNKNIEELEKEYEFVIPKNVRSNFKAIQESLGIVHQSQQVYTNMINNGVNKEDARFILPMGTKTKLYVKANFREWRHVIEERGLNDHAQWEIREFANEVLEYLYYEAPSIFEDLIKESDNYAETT